MNGLEDGDVRAGDCGGAGAGGGGDDRECGT